jgi:hypothetical protein
MNIFTNIAANVVTDIVTNVVTDVATNRVTGSVMNRVVNVDQKRQTLSGCAAFQAELGTPRTRVPAGGRDSQGASGKRRQRAGQIDIAEARQLLLGSALFAKGGHDGLPHLLPGYWNWRRVGQSARLFRQEPDRRARGGYEGKGDEAAGENRLANHWRYSYLPIWLTS